jgi:phage terminase Nu1 subunit (DNA packaging protein)
LPKHPAKTHAELASFFGVSTRTIGDWARGGMPGRSGRYRLDLIAQWRIKKIAERAPSQDKQLDAERIRKLRLANDETEGRLIDADDSERAWNRGLNRIRNRMEGLSAELEVLMPDDIRRAAKADVDSFIRQLLLEMASWDPAEA